jgi:hypothetical protein
MLTIQSLSEPLNSWDRACGIDANPLHAKLSGPVLYDEVPMKQMQTALLIPTPEGKTNAVRLDEPRRSGYFPCALLLFQIRTGSFN